MLHQNTGMTIIFSITSLSKPRRAEVTEPLLSLFVVTVTSPGLTAVELSSYPILQYCGKARSQQKNTFVFAHSCPTAAPVATISLGQLLKKPFVIQRFVRAEPSRILFAALQVVGFFFFSLVRYFYSLAMVRNTC